MRQLTYTQPGRLAWWDVPDAAISAPTDALVRPFIAARCDGDSLFLSSGVTRYLGLGARLHLLDPLLAEPRTNPFVGPFPYGHECVAEVIAVGEGVKDRAVGEHVIVPWSISCGACDRCCHGLTSHCSAQPKMLAAYGFGEAIGGYGGLVSDLVRVPHADHMLVPVPAGVDPLDLASASDNLCDAYRTVAPVLARRPGAPILVVGGGAKSIGLYAAGIAKALGSERVDYVDASATRLDIATKLGANAIERTRRSRFFERGWPPLERQYDGVVDASSTSSGLEYALNAMAPGGMCTAAGFYLRRGTPLPLWSMYLRSSTLHVGVSHPRRDLPSVIELVRRGALNPAPVHRRVADWADAAEAFLEPATKMIVRRAPIGRRPLSGDRA